MPDVVEIIETSEGLEGSASLETGDSRTRSFQVEFDGFNQSVDAARNAAASPLSVPAYGAPHPENPFIFAMKKTGKADPQQNGLIWIVTVEYGVPSGSASPADSPAAPGTDGDAGTDPPPADPVESQKLQWGTWTKTSAPEKDITGAVLRNSARDFYEQPPTRDDEYLQLTITRVQGSIDENWLANLNNCVNASAFTIGKKSFAARTLKVTISAEYPSGGKTPTWSVTIVIKHDPQGWDWELLNAGYFTWDGTARVPIYVKGVKPSRPQLLDAAGAKLAEGAAATYKTYRKHYTADFAYLGIGYPS